MSSSTINDLIAETENLLTLSSDARKQAGIYADNASLKLLLKKLNTSKSNPKVLNGVEKFVSDFASSDSKILCLLDGL